jgi:hypothetical protein
MLSLTQEVVLFLTSQNTTVRNADGTYTITLQLRDRK